MIIASLEDVATQMGQISKLVRLLATAGITSGHLQLAIDNKSVRANLVEFLKAECPKVDYTKPVPKVSRVSKRVGKIFDETVFFVTRDCLWVDSDLKRHVGLEVRLTRGAAALKTPRVLAVSEREDAIFGAVGSEQHINTLANAVDLGQIAGKLQVQWNGEEGELLTDGRVNIFPVRGLNGTLRVVCVNRFGVRWRVHCIPFSPDDVWDAGSRVFSN